MSLLLTYVYLHCSDYTHCIGSGDIRDTHSGCSLVNSDASIVFILVLDPRF